MRLYSVPREMYKKFFKILFFVFVGFLVVEFGASMLGFPLSEVTVNDEVVIPETPLQCLLHASISAFLISGIVNVFLTIRIIKEKLGIIRWPAFAVVIMTITFALEVLLGTILVIPNIIIFGIKSRKRNRNYEVDFR